MSFTDEQLESWWSSCRAVPEKVQTLSGQFITYPYREQRAREYAVQGFSRRFSTLGQCIQNVFELMPPERTENPSYDERQNATINIQAFLFNAFGCVDNLAWILFHEKALKRPDGKEIGRKFIGLGSNNTLFRSVVSAEFSAYLATRDHWFAYLEDYRHALAHRIPIYIPPYTITEAERADHDRLEHEKAHALSIGDFERAGQLDDEQDALGTFTPIMDHSPVESPGSIAFHRAMLVDFHTIEEMALQVLEELRR